MRLPYLQNIRFFCIKLNCPIQTPFIQGFCISSSVSLSISNTCSYSMTFNLFLVHINFINCPSVSVPGCENNFNFINYVCSTHLLNVLHWMLGLFILGLFS